MSEHTMADARTGTAYVNRLDGLVEASYYLSNTFGWTELEVELRLAESVVGAFQGTDRARRLIRAESQHK